MTKAALKNDTAVNTLGTGNYVPLTGATIASGIEAGLIALAGSFEEMEQRIVGDNGKAYPLDATLPDGVEDSGNIAIVNRFAFIQDRVLESVVDAIAYQLESAERRLADNIKSLQATRRIIDAGRSTLTEADMDRKLSFVETQEEQVALLQCAYKSAAQSYELSMGHAYATRAERKAMADARKAAASPAPSAERKARLDRFA
jgi:hypothetical protein